MKFGSKGLKCEEDYVLHQLFEEISGYILTTNQNQYAFIINKYDGLDENTCQRNVTYTSNTIPIQETVYEQPKLDAISFHKNKFTLKERVKILFKGKV